MATKQKVKLKLKPPSQTLQAWLEEGVKPDLKRVGEDVAKRITSSEHVPVEMRVTNNVKGRAVAILTVKHPKAIALQIKRGAITRAAALSGLKVTRYRV